MNITTLTRKFLAGEKLLKKEEDYLWKKLRDKADIVFKSWIRERDKHKDCVSSGAETCNHKIQNACHRIPCGRYSHRRDENNVYGGCWNCNGFNKSEHEKFFMIHQIKKYGQERVDNQLRIRNKKKPTIQELLDIIDKYV